MKLPDTFNNLLHKKIPKEELFLSLLLEAESVMGAVWSMGKRGTPEILATSTGNMSEDSWEARLDASDRIIGKLEEAVGTEDIEKVVLGLPAKYLTEEGDIHSHIRPHIKSLTKELLLKPIGFVPIHQAIVHKLKIDEGVPPSLILLQIFGKEVSLAVYKVGTLIGQRKMNVDNLIQELEVELKSFEELEVLPSRILLVGAKKETLEQIKMLLLKHSWPTRANFLHFPKIEILSDDFAVGAISFAGSSELSIAIGGENIDEEKTIVEQGENSEENAIINEQEEIAVNQRNKEESVKNAVIDNESLSQEKSIPEEDEHNDEESNFVEVTPEALGFGTQTSIRQAKVADYTHHEHDNSDDEGVLRIKRKLPKITLSSVSLTKLFTKIPHIPIKGKGIPLLLMGAVLLIGFSIVWWFLPRANVTVYQIPFVTEDRMEITIDPISTSFDRTSLRIPGKTLENVVSGEKIIPVTGKKQVGDPAKGMVTIYNKATSSRNFKKGSILTNGSLSFTLDDDVQVASASESIGSITFGKTNAKLTASAIGTKSNLPANTEFSFKDISTNIAIARNDQALSGGTSRDVTVVTRSDYDSLVEALTEELVDKAQNDLTQSIEGSEKLVKDTVKAIVAEKSFLKELNEEADELQGKITVRITGITYNDQDVFSVLETAIQNKIPANYTFVKEKSRAEVTSTKINKDGTILAVVAYKALGIPVIETELIKTSITGKSIKEAENYLRNIPGLGAVEFRFKFSLTHAKLPPNKNNVSVSLAVQE